MKAKIIINNRKSTASFYKMIQRFCEFLIMFQKNRAVICSPHKFACLLFVICRPLRFKAGIPKFFFAKLIMTKHIIRPWPSKSKMRKISPRIPALDLKGLVIWISLKRIVFKANVANLALKCFENKLSYLRTWNLCGSFIQCTCHNPTKEKCISIHCDNGWNEVE